MLTVINRDRCNFYVMTSNAFGVNRFLRENMECRSSVESAEIFVFFFLGNVTVFGNFDKVVAIDSSIHGQSA